MSTRSNSPRLLVAACVLTVGGSVLIACGDDDPPSGRGAEEVTTTTTIAPSTTTTSGHDARPDLNVTAVDYAYEGLPDHVDAGSHLHLTNSSAGEVHEAVVFRVPDDRADTPLAELLAAAEADPTALGDFVGVAVALPGEEGIEPEGSVVFDEPGRYIVACFVPVGSDPAIYAEAIESGEPPDTGDGPPHVAAGMVTEVIVG